MMKSEPNVLASALWPHDRMSLLRAVILVLAGSLLLTLAAKIKVPFYPVPMTMQPLAVIALALALGSRLSVAAVFAYLAQGAAGLPVFTGTPPAVAGLAYLIGPTGGFLVGFALAAAVTGALADRGWARSYIGALVASLVGLVVLYAPGVLWLGQLIGFEQALAAGVAPFILKDLVATVLAGLIVPTLWAVSRKRAG